jgi:hypothetical protein
MEGGSYTGDFERTRFYQETLFTGDPARCQRRLCKRTSLSIGAPLGTCRGTRFIGDFEREMKERSGNGVSLSMGALRDVPGKRAVKDV